MEDRTVASWRSLIPRLVTVGYCHHQLLICALYVRSTLHVNFLVSLTSFCSLLLASVFLCLGLCVKCFSFFIRELVLHIMHLHLLFCLTTLALLLFLSFLPQVRAHGYVAKVTIDGTVYAGNVPNAQPTPSIVRQINNIAPVKGASNAYLNCGQDAQKAALVANANPGSQVQFLWLDGDGTNVSSFFFRILLGSECRA